MDSTAGEPATEADEVEAPAAPETAPVERSLPEPDPLYATPLSMRPNEIQARLRAGATATELAEEMGVTRERVRQIEVRAFEKLQAALLRLAGDQRLLPAA